MLRASSEMAVAMSVASPVENPSSVARAGPRCRAATISWSELMATRISPALTVSLSVYVLELLNQVRQTFLQVQRRRNVFQGQPQLHHGKGHFRLYPHDHRFRAAQPDHVRDLPQRPRRERVHHVHRRHIHDHPPRAKLHYLLHQTTPQVLQVRVRERRLKGGNQHLSLFQTADFHVALLPSFPCSSGFPPASPLCSPAVFPPVRCPLAGRPRCSSSPDPPRSSPRSAQSPAKGR